MPITLALDLGTTSLTALAVNEAGKIVAKLSRDHEANITRLPGGHAEQDPNRLLQQSVSLLQSLNDDLVDHQCEPPLVLGITGQMHGMLAVDQKRQPLTNLITWQDRRANEKLPNHSHSSLDEYLHRISKIKPVSTGCRLSPGYLAVTAFTLSQQGLLPSKTAKFSFLSDWLSAELRDGEIMADPTMAASSGVYDVQNHDWSESLIQAGRLNRDHFPVVQNSGAIIGTLSKWYANATGLPEGLPIGNGIGDNQASVLGSGPIEHAAIRINIGTGGQINWLMDQLAFASGMETRPFPEGQISIWSERDLPEEMLMPGSPGPFNSYSESSMLKLIGIKFMRK